MLEKFPECFTVDAVKRLVKINECEVQRGIPLQGLFNHYTLTVAVWSVHNLSLRKPASFFTRQPVNLLLHPLNKNAVDHFLWY